MIPSKPTNDAEIEAAVRAELSWLLERRQDNQRAAAEDTVSGRLRRAVAAMRQPYEQVCQATGIPFESETVDLLREVHEHAVEGDIAWLKTKGDRYVKIVEWSDEDNCFIGSCPELFYGGCHGNDAKQVFAELCELVEEAIETLEQAGKPLPQPLSRSEFGSLMQRSA